jgi:hypothetical protein
MDIRKIVSKVLEEAISKKDIPPLILKKLVDAYPKFGSLPPEEQNSYVNGVIDRHDKLKPVINMDDSRVFNFLTRHDGAHGSRKITLDQLKDITQAPFPEMIDFLIFMGKFEKHKSLSDGGADETEVTAKSPEEEREEMFNTVFSQNGVQKTPKKIELSKEMWVDPDSAIINEDGVRVYKIVNETQSMRMGYYYQSIHVETFKSIRNLGPEYKSYTKAPWCQTWRGKAVAEKDESGTFLFDHSPSKWRQMREMHGYSFYYIIDDKINPLEDILKKGKWHMASLMVDEFGGYKIASLLNDGEVGVDWKDITTLYPPLSSHEGLFTNEEFNRDELQKSVEGVDGVEREEDRITEREGSKREFARLLPEEQIAYIDAGGDITKVKSWKSMSKEVRVHYINSIDESNISHKISNSLLLSEILRTEGFKEKLNRRVKNAVSKMMSSYIKSDYDLDYMGKKNPTTNVYSSKRSGLMGIFDTTELRWVEKNGILYNDKFNKGKMYRFKGADGNRYFVFEFISTTDSDKFYVVNDEPFVDSDRESAHKGYILSAKMFDKIKIEVFDVDPNKFDRNKHVDIAELSLQ